MSGFDEDVRLTVYAEGVETIGGTVAFTRREDQLEGVESLGGSRARPLDARAETLRSTFTVLDENDDLSSEIFDSNGRPRVLNRLFQIEIRWDGGTWKNVAAGRVLDVQDSGGSAYQFQIGDEGQLLREQKAFDTNLPDPFGGGADTAAVLPRGLIDPWRGIPAIEPIEAWVSGDFKGTNDEVVGIRLGGASEAFKRKGPATLTDDLQNLILDDLRTDANAFVADPAIEDGRGGFEHLRLRDVDGGQDLEVLALGDLTANPNEDEEFRGPMKQPSALWLYWPGNTVSRGDTFDCYLYMPGHPPNETLPLHFGGDSGVNRWQHAKDGLEAVGLRYDTAAIDALIGQGEKIWPRVVDNPSMFEHLRRTVLFPSGYMLAPDSRGRLTPVRIAAPRDEDVTGSEPTLDRTVVGPDRPTWKHSREDQVTVINFRGQIATSPQARVSYVGPPTKGDPTAIDLPLSGSADGLTARTVEIEKTHRVDDFGRRGITIEVRGLRNRGELERIASTLSNEIFSRWGDGLMLSQFGALKQHEDLSPGDYLFVDLDDFPNPALQGRGGTRFVQVLERVKDLRPGVDLRVADVGADNQPLTAPSIGASQNANRPESVIDLSLSGLDAEASFWVIEYAKSATEPAVDSDAWTRLTSDTVLTTSAKLDGAEAGSTYWFRARVHGFYAVGSPWSTAVSATTAGLGSITGVSIGSITGSSAEATWTVPNDDNPVRLVLQNTTAGTTEMDQTLDPGTQRKTLIGLSAGDSYELDLQLVDDAGENNGPVTTTSFTAGATNEQLPAPTFIGIQYGRTEHVGEREQTAQTGVVVWSEAADPVFPLTFQRAPDDGAGNPDTNSIEDFRQEIGSQQFVDTSVSPGQNNGDGYWYRAIHKADGYDDSLATEWARAWPVALPASIGPAPSEPLVDIDLRIDSSGNVSLFFDGQPSVKAIRYDVGTTDFASLDADGGTLVTTDSDGDADVADIITINADQTAFVQVAAYRDEAADGSPIASRSGSYTRGGGGSGTDSDTVHPTVDAQTSQPTASTGRLSLTVFDPDLRVTSVRFKKKVDAGGFEANWQTSWDNNGISTPGTPGTDDVLTRNEDVVRSDKHNTAIKWQVLFDDADGNPRSTAGTHEFDVNNQAQINTLSAWGRNSDGHVIVSATGDDDVDTGQAPSLKFWVGVGSPPDTSTSPDFTVDNSQSVDDGDTGVSIAHGETAYVVAVGVDSDGNDGPETSVTTQREGFPPEVDLDLINWETDIIPGGLGWETTFEFEITASSEYSGANLEVRYKYDNIANLPDTWSSWQTPPVTISGTLKNTAAVEQWIFAQARDTSQSPAALSSVVSFAIGEDTEPWIESHAVSADAVGNLVSKTLAGSRGEGGALWFTIATGADPTAPDPVFTTLDADASSGATTLSVADASIFSANDTVQVGDQGSIEEHTVSSVDGTNDNITISSGLSNGHTSGEKVVKADHAVDLGSGVREAVVSWSNTLSKGEVVEIAARIADSNGGMSGPGRIVRDRGTRPDEFPVEVDATQDRTAGTATVSVAVTGLGSYDIELLEVAKDGSTSSLVSNTGVTDGGANDPTATTQNLNEKTNLLIKAVVKDNVTGGTLVEQVYTFDPLEKPEFRTLSAQASPSGKIQVIFLGDVDTGSYQIEYDPDGDSTVEQTVTADGNSAVDTSDDSIPTGTTGEVTVTLYSGTGQTGTSISETLQVPFRVDAPFLGQNINDWNAAPSGGLSGTDKRFGMRINLAAPEVIVGFLNADDSTNNITYEVELEFSNEVTIDGVNTSDDTGVWPGTGDTTSINGQVVTLSGSHASGHDAYTINCTGLNPDTVITVRLKRYDHGSLTWNVSLGDRIVRSSPDEPIIPFEFSVTPSDASNYDIGDLLNAGDLAELNAIDTTEITDDAVTTPKVNAGAITAAKIQAGTVTANEIAADTITANEIAADTITAAQIAANTITASQIAADTITASEIAAGTITATEIAADTITASEISAGSITATELSVSKLDDIADDVGILIAGELRGVAGSSEIDLNATGNNPFLSTTDFRIEADGDAFFSNTVRGEQVDHGNVSGTVTLDVTNGNIHYFNLTGATTIDVSTPPGLEGVTIVVAVDHNGNSLSWSESSTTTNLMAAGGTIPDGSGLTIFTLSAYDTVSGPSTRWVLGMGPTDVQNVF